MAGLELASHTQAGAYTMVWHPDFGGITATHGCDGQQDLRLGGTGTREDSV